MIENKIIKFIAQAISIILHPLIIPTIACIVIFNSGFYLEIIPAKIIRAIYLIVFMLSFAVPALIISALYLQKKIGAFTINERKERVLPLILMLIIYLLAYYFMWRHAFPPIFLNFFVGTIIATVLALLITFNWKISLHTIGMGGLIALIAALSYMYNLDLFWLLASVIIIAGIVGTARMIAGTHSSMQIYSGYFVGFLSVFCTMIWL